jgi:GDPmannose 4,6-dehydratase
LVYEKINIKYIKKQVFKNKKLVNIMNLEETYFKKKIDTINILNIDNAVKMKKSDYKCVIVTGVTGQDGSHMVDYLLKNTDYIIFGGVRRLSVYNHTNIKHINSDRFHLINFDLNDSNIIYKVIEKLQPDYFINFAAQSYVACSWDFVKITWETNCTAVIDILEAIKIFKPTCRLYQAGSSEEFGNVNYSPQDENHPLKPRSPYGASKVASRQIIKVYRESYNLYTIQGWLFNHEGTRRGEDFVTRKITKNVARIYNSINNKTPFEPIELGNIYAKRDWSDSEDFIDGVWKMLNQDIYNKDYDGIPREYVFSSNETHTIKEFVEIAFKHINVNGYWKNETNDNINEKYCYINHDNEEVILVKINSSFYRLAEIDLLCGNSSKARNELNWIPQISFEQLVEKMIKNDVKLSK